MEGSDIGLVVAARGPSFNGLKPTSGNHRIGGNALAADKPNDKRQDDRDNHAGRDRKVENAALCFDANVSRQASETESGEPWP